MSRRREALRAGSHWHVDCRIAAELPEDNLVRAKFVFNLLLGALTLSLLLVFSWFAYSTYNLRQQIKDSEQRIQASMPRIISIQRMQRDYVAEASKIDQVYGAIRPALVVSDFVDVLARALPPEVFVDSLDWNDSEVVLRGTARESRLRASTILNEYLDKLRTSPKIGDRFGEIKISAFDPPKNREAIQPFRITFSLLPLEPL